MLHCNGRLMEVADTATIKQARLLNGSKILCTYSSQRQEQADCDSVIQVLKTIETNGTVIETKLDTLIKRRKELLKEEILTSTPVSG